MIKNQKLILDHKVFVSQEKFFHRKAKEVLRNHFITQRKEPRKTPFFQSQLQIFYEKDFFPWVVADVLKELVAEGYLTKITEKEIPDFDKLDNLRQITFYVHTNAVRNRNELDGIKRKAFRISQIVNSYSKPSLSKTLGDHLESLVKAELRAQQFTIVGKNTNEFDGKKWTKSEHDLDFIAVHRNGKLKIGVEVKNTLSIIPPAEIDTKIEICEFLGINPVFAVRWIKPYFYCINNQGGFCWLFKTQCYPLGFEDYTQMLYKKLSDVSKTDSVGHELEFPIKVRKDLPELSVKLFEEWVDKNKDCPPVVDTASDRCSKQSS